SGVSFWAGRYRNPSKPLLLLRYRTHRIGTRRELLLPTHPIQHRPRRRSIEIERRNLQIEHIHPIGNRVVGIDHLGDRTRAERFGNIPDTRLDPPEDTVTGKRAAI